MMRFTLNPEPSLWDERCRKRGQKWLSKHVEYDRPRDYWTKFEPQLREAFSGLCAFCAMKVMKADMEHFLPISLLKQTGQPEKAYEWSNFRYVEGVLNQRKSDHLLIDPFEVEDDWFEIHLPSLQLHLTDKVPEKMLPRAQLTLERLGLQNDEVVLRYRMQWFEMYQNGELILEGLRKLAPLIANAVENHLAQGKDWRNQPQQGKEKAT